VTPDPKNLDREISQPGKGGRQWSFEDKAKAITPTKLATIFADANKGKLDELIGLARGVEEKDLHARAQLSTRKLAMTLPWRVVAPTDRPADVAMAERVASWTIDRPGWASMVRDAMDAVLCGFSALEIIWSKGAVWTPDRVEWRDQRHFQLDEATGREIRLKVEGKAEGDELPPAKFILHRPHLLAGPVSRVGLVRPLGVAYSIKTLGLTAWLTFVEIFGVPWRIGTYERNASDDDKEALEDAMLALGLDAAGIVPNGTRVQIEQAVSGTADAHERLIRWVDDQVSKVVLGQTMTADNGASLSQAKVHNEVRRDILHSDARDLEETINRDLIRPLVDLNFGPQENYPRVVCLTDPAEDRREFAEVVSMLVDRGLRVEQSVVRDRIGVDQPAADAEVLAPRGASPADATSSTAPASTSSKNGKAFTAGLTSTADAADFIDEEVADVAGGGMEALLQEVRDAAKDSETFSAFLARLASAEVDGDRLVRALATKTTIARTVGDATDEVELP